MHTFTDTTGRCWRLAIHAPAIKRVRALTGVDLMDAVGGGLLARLGADVVLLVDVLYALCEPQARELEVSDVQFGESLGGDTIEEATTAFLEELLGFFPKAPRRLLAKALTRAQTLVDAGMAKAEHALENGRLDGALSMTSSPGPRPGGSSTNAPASAASTPEI